MLDLRFLAALVANNQTEILLNDEVDKLLEGSPSLVFGWIREFYQKYNHFPSFAFIKKDQGLDLEEWFDNSSSCNAYLDLIVERYRKNTLKELNHYITTALETDEASLDDIASFTHTALAEIQNSLNQQKGISYASEFEIQQDRRELYLKQKNASDFVTGIPSPWRELDEITCGWKAGELITILGRTNIGKTFFLMLLAIEALKQDKTVLFCSLEMSNLPLMLRHDAIRLQISYRNLKRGRLSYHQENRYLDYLSKNDNTGSLIIASPELVQSPAKVESLIEKENPDIVFIDAFYKMGVKNRAAAVWERVSDIIWDLKLSAERRQIPIIVSGQFNKQISPGSERRSGKRGQVQDVSFTYAISQDSDLIIGLHQDWELEELNIMQVCLLKMRNDEKEDIWVNWDLDVMRFDVMTHEEVQRELADFRNES